MPGPRWQAPPYVDVQGSSLVNDIIVKSGIGRTEEQHHQLRQQIATLVKLMQGSTRNKKTLMERSRLGSPPSMTFFPDNLTRSYTPRNCKG